MNSKLNDLAIKCATAVRNVLEPLNLSISEADEVIDMMTTYFVGNSLMQVKVDDEKSYLQMRLMLLSGKLEHAALAVHNEKCPNCSQEGLHENVHAASPTIH